MWVVRLWASSVETASGMKSSDSSFLNFMFDSFGDDNPGPGAPRPDRWRPASTHPGEAGGGHGLAHAAAGLTGQVDLDPLPELGELHREDPQGLREDDVPPLPGD